MFTPGSCIEYNNLIVYKGAIKPAIKHWKLYCVGLTIQLKKQLFNRGVLAKGRKNQHMEWGSFVHSFN